MSAASSASSTPKSSPMTYTRSFHTKDGTHKLETYQTEKFDNKFWLLVNNFLFAMDVNNKEEMWVDSHQDVDSAKNKCFSCLAKCPLDISLSATPHFFNGTWNIYATIKKDKLSNETKFREIKG